LAADVGGLAVGGLAVGKEGVGGGAAPYKSPSENKSSENVLRFGRTSSKSFESFIPNHCATPFHTASHDKVGITIPGEMISGPSSDKILGYLPMILFPRISPPVIK